MYQRTTNVILFLSLLCLFNLSVIDAEAKDQRTGEEKIRIKAPPTFIKPTEAKFRSIKGDSLYFDIKGESHSIRLTEIRKIEIPVGNKKNTANGMVAGSLIGTLGLGLAAVISVSNEDGIFTPEPGPAFLFGGFLGSVLGLGLGAIIGNGVYSVEWEEISINELSNRQSLAMTPYTNSILDTKEIKRWHLSFISGSNSGGPKNDIEHAMTHGGFNDISPGGWFSNPNTTPKSRTGFGEIGIPWILALNYQIDHRWKLGIEASSTPIGKTSGYSDNPYGSIDLEYNVFAIAPKLYFKLFPHANLGAGPAYYRTTCKQIEFGETGGDFASDLIGALLEFSLTFPEETNLYVEFKTQYRWIPKTKAGPFIIYNSNNLVLHEFNADYSHLFIGLGIGIHL